MNYTEFVKEVCDVLSFPAEAVTCFVGLQGNLASNPAFAETLEELVTLFCQDNTTHLGDIIPKVEALAVQHGENPYTLDLVYIMHCAYYTRIRYRESGLSEELFWDSMTDLRYKLLECMTCKNVPGTFVAAWNEGFLRLGRFSLGRFQYEPNGIYQGEDMTLACGYTLTKGTRYLNFHIPSSGVPLTDDVRLDSYRQAYEYFRTWSGGEVVLLHTSSWLLNPVHYKILPPHSNILRFMDDFEIYTSAESEKFGNAWRIFGAYAELPVSEWPEDTSLRRAFKAHILSGGKSGHGCGFIVMHNGENVTHRPGYFEKA